MIKKLRSLVWTIIIICLGITWLPYFNVFNSAEFMGRFPQPLAITLLCNVILTLCNASLYWLYFKPFQRALDRSELSGETQP